MDIPCDHSNCQGTAKPALPSLYSNKEKGNIVQEELDRYVWDADSQRLQVDRDRVGVGKDAALLGLRNPYCPNCQKEHGSYLRCKPTGEVYLECIQIRPAVYIMTLIPESTRILFHDVSDIEEAMPNAFGDPDSFPVLCDTPALNAALYESLAGYASKVATFMCWLLANDCVFVDRQWYAYEKLKWRKSLGPDFSMNDIGVPYYEKLLSHYAHDPKKRRAIEAVIYGIQNGRRRRYIVELMERMLEADETMSAIKMGAKPHLFAFQNGVFDTRTMTMREHRRDDYLTTVSSRDLPNC